MMTPARAVMVLPTVGRNMIGVVRAWQSTHSLALESQNQMGIGTNVSTATLSLMEAQRLTSVPCVVETMLALDVMVSRTAEGAWMRVVSAVALIHVSVATTSQTVGLSWIGVATVVVQMRAWTVRACHTVLHHTTFAESVTATAQHVWTAVV
jgi:hypothetical protein